LIPGLPREHPVIFKLASFLIDIFRRIEKISFFKGGGHTNMQLLLYASQNNKNENRLAAAIQAATPGMAIERFMRLDDLRERLRSIVEPNSIAVLLAEDREELHKIQAFRDMLTEIYIILVLPDRQESTVKLAHLLKPRFLSSVDDDFTDLNQIVAKMIRAPHGTPANPFNAGNPAGFSGSRP
jgi:hypothetical protein